MKALGFASIPAVQRYLKTAAAQAWITDLPWRGRHRRNLLVTTQTRARRGLAIPAGRTDSGQWRCALWLTYLQYIQPASYSVLGYIAMNCRDIGEGLGQGACLRKIVGDMGVTRTVQAGENTQVRWQCSFDNVGVRRHVIENVLASWTRYSRWVGFVGSSALGCVSGHSLPRVRQWQITSSLSVAGAV